MAEQRFEGDDPKDTVIGIRDYGRTALFSDMRIQDIAGNIDPAVVTALNNGTLDEYLKERNVQYLAIPSLDERQDKLYVYLHTHLHLQQVKDSSGQLVKLYKIIW